MGSFLDLKENIVLESFQQQFQNSCWFIAKQGFLKVESIISYNYHFK